MEADLAAVIGALGLRLGLGGNSQMRRSSRGNEAEWTCGVSHEKASQRYKQRKRRQGMDDLPAA